MPNSITRSRTNSLVRQLAGLAAAATLLVGGTPVEGGQSGATVYGFTTILDSLRDRLEPTRCAAINDSGTVAVQVRDAALGINKIVTKRRANDAPVVVVDTRAAADFPTFCDNGITLIASDPSINDNGEVAFQGNLRRLNLATRPDCATTEQRQRRQGVFRGGGGQPTTIAHTINQPGGDFIAEFLVADHSVNNAGSVAFVPELDVTFDQGLFVGSGTATFEQRYLRSEGVFNGTSSRVSLNEVGQIAFQDTLRGSFTQGIFLSNPDGTFTTIVDSSSGEIDAMFDPSLNRFGAVAFQGFKFVNNVQVRGIFISDGGPVLTVADSTGLYSTFGEPSLNDAGAVVFTAHLDSTASGRQIQGVFTGPNSRTDKVLQTGDRYDGALVTGVSTCSEALNNLGEIVMSVFSEDPDTFEVRRLIVKATPR